MHCGEYDGQKRRAGVLELAFGKPERGGKLRGGVESDEERVGAAAEVVITAPRAARRAGGDDGELARCCATERTATASVIGASFSPQKKRRRLDRIFWKYWLCISVKKRTAWDLDNRIIFLHFYNNFFLHLFCILITAF